MPLVGSPMLSRMPANSIGRNLGADVAINLIDQTRGLLDARAGLGANMQPKLAGIHGGKEVLPEERDQAAG